MPKTTAKVSNRPRWLGAKSGFAKHHLVGANTTILTMLRDNAAQLEVTSTNMDLSIDRARAMLQSAATVEIVAATVTDGVLEARVKVQNNSGHKAPTAYPSRRMWLHFKLTDSSNNVVFESGKINADGSIVAADNDADQMVFEPHYDLITSPDQVQIYETVMGDSDGNITYTLLRGAQYLKDNRLTPQGFDKYAVPADVAVHGQAANDANFNLGVDEVVYRFPVTASGDLQIAVSLNYQTIAHGFVLDLYKESHLEQVQTFKTLYDAQSLKHEPVASATTTVVNDGGTLPPVAPTLSLTGSPTTIDQGQLVTLDWVATDANSCNADWTSITQTSGSEVVSPTVTTSYTMTCNGDGGSVIDSVTITVNSPTAPPPVMSLTASAATIDQGQSVTLSWDSFDTNTCNADWTTSNAISGAETLAPTATTTYTMTCTGDGGSVSDSVTVTVNPTVVPAPTVTLTADPARVSVGGTITLTWSSTDADSCAASGDWSGTKAVSGSEAITINSAVSFTLSCTGAGGTASGTVGYTTWGRRFLNRI